MARGQTERLDAFWRSTNRPNLRGDRLLYELLSEAATLLRPGHAFAATLGHVDGPDVVLDAVAGRFSIDGEDALHRLPIGTRVNRAELLDASDIDGPRTLAWFDCQTVPRMPASVRASGLRSQISTRFEAGGAIRVLTFGSNDAPAEPPFDQSDNVYIELLASFFARHIEFEHMQHSLVAAELGTRQHAERLAALSEIADSTALTGDDLLHALLRQAAETIRPAQRFGGFLGRIEGEEIVVIALGARAHDTPKFETRLQLGERKPLAQTVIPRDSRTQGWDDLAALPEPPLAVAELGWRASISTLFEAGGERYVLTFASPEPASVPFSGDDVVYVDVIAASIAKRLEVTQLTDLLRNEKELSSQQADRLEALLSIASIPSIIGDMLMRAMMGQAASGLRPGQRFRGILGSIEGDEVSIVCSSFDVANDDPQAPFIGTGRHTSLSRTIIPPTGTTRAWDDLSQADTYSTGGRDLGWASAIARRFTSGDREYSLTLYCDEPVDPPFNANDTAYVEVLCASLAKQLEVNRLQDTLREAEERSRRHADRLEGLWKIVNDAALRDDELLLAMLREAASGIQLDQAFTGLLYRIDGDHVIIEAVAHGSNSESVQKAGDATPLAGSIIGSIVAEGARTRSWDDVNASGVSSFQTFKNDTRALVITTFSAGGSAWGLAFDSSEPSRKPLTRLDESYVELLASFFANHVQQRRQFERIKYQQSHDGLTGLLNRSQFNSRARDAARTSTRFGVILVGIDAFREINESYGHMIGDALLVEVANALVQRAEPNEIVGRIGGDIFGIYVGDPADADAVRRRAVAFANAFSRPFPTGGREGKEFVSRSASFGVAVAPDDGALIDDILSRADAALVSANAADTARYERMKREWKARRSAGRRYATN